MLAQIHLAPSEEIRDHEATTHDQLVRSNQQVQITEEEIERLKVENEAIINEKMKEFEDRKIIERELS